MDTDHGRAVSHSQAKHRPRRLILREQKSIRVAGAMREKDRASHLGERVAPASPADSDSALHHQLPGSAAFALRVKVHVPFKDKNQRNLS